MSTPLTPIFLSSRPTDTPPSAAVDDERGDAVVRAGVDRAGLGEHAVPVGLARPPTSSTSVPERIQSSPSGTARVRMPITSLPACGSDKPNAARGLAARDGRDVAALLLLGAGDEHRARSAVG